MFGTDGELGMLGTGATGCDGGCCEESAGQPRCCILCFNWIRQKRPKMQGTE
jgi:hypothetical protein